MAWTLLENISTNVVIESICSDGISKIFYGKSSGTAHQYDVDTDTVTGIGNSTSLGGVTADYGHLRYFGGSLYAASVVSNDYPDVYKWASGTSWSQVFTPTGLSYPTFAYGNWCFMAGKERMILGMSGGNDTTDYEILCFYTSTGLTWNTGTAQEGDVAPPLVLGVPPEIPFLYVVNWNNQILDDLYCGYLMQSGVVDDNNLYKLMKWSDPQFNTVDWRKKVSGVVTGEEWVKDYIVQDNAHWADGTSTGSDYHYEEDPLTGAFAAPASQDFLLSATATGVTIPSQGFPVSYLSVGYKTTSLGGGNNRVDMVLINSDGSLETAEEITSSGDRSVEAFIRMPESGNVYAVMLSGTNYEIWDRGTPLDPPAAGVHRLWMYKSTDGGLSWASRGIQTA